MGFSFSNILLVSSTYWYSRSLPDLVSTVELEGYLITCGLDEVVGYGSVPAIDPAHP